MVEGGLPDPRSRGRTPSGGLGGPVAKDAEGRLVVGALRRMWSVASKPPSKSQQEVADALPRLMPPEAYATALVDLTKSHDKRVQARALELIAKLRGLVEEQPRGTLAVVAFRSVLTGKTVARHQGGDARQEQEEGPDPLDLILPGPE